jgi:hypothetical protein
MSLFNKPVRNTQTNEIGIVVKHCAKSLKVCCVHPTIRGAHCYKYWKTIETI